MKHSRQGRFFRATATATAAMILFGAGVAYAQQSLGSVSGRAVAGGSVDISNPSIGINRSVKADSTGTFNFASLPAGTYTVTFTQANGTKVTRTVEVVGGTGAVANFVDNLDRVVVSSGPVGTVDTRSSESSQIVTKAELDRIPVSKNTTAIALLAPGTTLGDARFGNVASIGGSSAAENAYYINGFNVTNILKGLAFNQIPAEAIASQEMKIGGYGAEYGRSLGGVVNVTTRRGTNEFHGGFSMSYAPKSLSGGSQYFDKNSAGAWTAYDREGGSNAFQTNTYLSGPIIKDQLYFFGLVQGNNVHADSYGVSTQYDARTKTPNYLAKFDWNLNRDNLIELTAFSDKSRTDYMTYKSLVRYDTPKGAAIGTSYEVSGGTNVIGSWSGRLSDNLGVRVLAGNGQYSRVAAGQGADCPISQNRLGATTIPMGCYNPNSAIVGDLNAGETRQAQRVDFEWNLGKHTVKFGLDREKITTIDATMYSGGGLFYSARNLAAGRSLANGYVNTSGATEQYVQLTRYISGGTFTAKNSAVYVEDQFEVNKNLILNLGLRSEGFENFNPKGDPFISIKNTIAPRLGAVWDVDGNSQTKVYASAGRYYIPVYTNTNARLAGSEIYTTDYYRYGGGFSTDRTQIPLMGAKIGDQVVYSNGEMPDPRTVVDSKIKPLFQDEFTLGLERALGNRWTVGARVIHRKLRSGMDDICSGVFSQRWAANNGYTAAQAAAIGAAVDHCFLFNPGEDLNINVDFAGDGKLTPVRIPASAIGIPTVVRTYNALALTFERAWDKQWMVKGSYVLSYSKGNTEGYVKSDNGQSDAGLTQDFDFPGLTEGAKGYLPNDRRHTFKAFGSYALNDEWRLGGNVLLQSGRPKNCFGTYAGTIDPAAVKYTDASFYCTREGETTPTLNSRGSFGRMPWVFDMGIQVAYSPVAFKGFSFITDVTNLLDRRTVTVIDEHESPGITAMTSQYGRPLATQSARRVRFTAKYEF